eukprot:evm.model.scf_1537.1 EVM.evm.TU.scf_1537.1   scf_1537:609-895(-)
MGLADAAIALGSLGALFLAGAAFLNHSLYRDLETGDRPVTGMFCAVFALSCNLLELLLFEITGVMGAGARMVNWRLDIWGLMFLLLVALPFYHSF